MNTIKRAGVLTTAALTALLWVGVPAGARDTAPATNCPGNNAAHVAPEDGARRQCGEHCRGDHPCQTTSTTVAETTTTTAPPTESTTTTAPPASPAPTPEPADLDCGDPGTSPGMPVDAGDPHDLDADDDGIGCEAPTPAPAAAPVVAQPTYTG